jgi:hypothetical protein
MKILTLHSEPSQLPMYLTSASDHGKVVDSTSNEASPTPTRMLKMLVDRQQIVKALGHVTILRTTAARGYVVYADFVFAHVE